MTDLVNGRFDNIPETALAWHRAGKGAVLATVIETWGSAPRRTGAQLVVSGTGEMAGSVSGGCVEGAVIAEALETLQSGEARELEFGVADEDAFAVGLACGGTIRVLVEPVGTVLPEPLLARLVAERAARRPVAYVAHLDTGLRTLERDGYDERMRMDRSGFDEDARRFVAIHNPPLRLIVIGAVHIAQALLPMARLAGYDPVVIDPRPAFAAPGRFPETRVIDDWPDEALNELAPDTRTAVVLLTHDPKIDDPALHRALASGAFYIGALGSTRTHAKRLARLKDAGFDADAIARIHAPVGLDIGASGPAEIAVAVLAEMIRTLRRGD